jgi:Co/Zn/Cd efflux system component
MLYSFREGDANMRSVWLCTRNDAIGSFSVMFAAIAVSSTGSEGPDPCVSLTARLVIIPARQELTTLSAL